MTQPPKECSSCGQRILFVRDQNDKVLPVNWVRVRAYGDDGKFLTDEKGGAILVRVSHFLTCPNAMTHSRGGR